MINEEIYDILFVIIKKIYIIYNFLGSVNGGVYVFDIEK
jgi:hypothetical protein